MRLYNGRLRNELNSFRFNDASIKVIIAGYFTLSNACKGTSSINFVFNLSFLCSYLITHYQQYYNHKHISI